jgi:CRISPR-associated protein Cas2
MRHLFIVAYDIPDDRRRTKVHRVLSSFGTSLQYSIFACPLAPIEQRHLRDQVWPLLNHATDRFLLADLGPVDGRGSAALEIWGQEMNPLNPLKSLTTERAARII